MKNCPKCGGPMEKKGRGTDHNLRIENRTVLKVRHETRHIMHAARPLMYVCARCGYIEFYAPPELSRSTKIGKGSGGKPKSIRDDHSYFT